MNDLKCTKHAIGYIDLLGAKEKINEDQNLCLQKMKMIILFIKALQDRGTELIYLKNLKVKAFSDNIVFAIAIDEETTQEEALIGIITACSFFQRLLISEFLWLSRGAITIGDLYIDDDIVWGTGLVRAYKLENDIAIFPRVILDSNLLETLNVNDLDEERKYLLLQKLKTDFDRLFYIDFTIMDDNDLKEFLVRMECTCAIQYRDDDKVAQKIAWLEELTDRVKKSLEGIEE